MKGNEKQFELAGNSSYWGNFQWNFDQGKGNLVPVSGEFELSECIPSWCPFSRQKEKNISSQCVKIIRDIKAL